jgi:DNA damage-binding protein 1
VYKVVSNNFDEMKLEKQASYRTSTAPMDITVSGEQIAVADLMKSATVLQHKKDETGVAGDTLTETARHYQTVWSTAIAFVEKGTLLESDAQGNLIVLSRDEDEVLTIDQRRLRPTSEISLGEMVNRIRPVNIPKLENVVVTPRAFVATVYFILILFFFFFF